MGSDLDEEQKPELMQVREGGGGDTHPAGDTRVTTVC
jgi:hypothetical protein